MDLSDINHILKTEIINQRYRQVITACILSNDNLQKQYNRISTLKIIIKRVFLMGKNKLPKRISKNQSNYLYSQSNLLEIGAPRKTINFALVSYSKGIKPTLLKYSHEDHIKRTQFQNSDYRIIILIAVNMAFLNKQNPSQYVNIGDLSPWFLKHCNYLQLLQEVEETFTTKLM